MVVTGRSRKAFAGNRTWVRIPPFPPISETDLLLEVCFAIVKVGFERRAFPERTARKKKCEGRTIKYPPFPPISEIDLLLEVYFAIAKVGFERQAFPERIARNQKCEGRTIGPHLFRSSGGIRRRAFPKRIARNQKCEAGR